MGRYRVEIAHSAEKVLLQLPKQVVPKIIAAIRGLENDPYPTGCRKLTGASNAFRIRVQVYRIIYEVYEDIVLIKVLKIGHRKDVYRV